jgi:hypothetical protein
MDPCARCKTPHATWESCPTDDVKSYTSEAVKLLLMASAHVDHALDALRGLEGVTRIRKSLEAARENLDRAAASSVGR